MMRDAERLMIHFLILLSSLVRVEVGQATVFACAGDVHAGGPSRALGRQVRPDDHGFAHRTLPDLASAIVIHPGARTWTVARKIDSGPYGAVRDGAWRVMRRLEPGWRYRSIADLTPATARALGATRAQSRCQWKTRVWLVYLKYQPAGLWRGINSSGSKASSPAYEGRRRRQINTSPRVS